MSVALPASEFNKAVDYFVRGRLLYQPSDVSRIPHAWRTRCQWNAQRKRWEAVMAPGVVNESDVRLPNNSTLTLSDAEPPSFELPASSFAQVTSGQPLWFRQFGVSINGERDEEIPKRILASLEIILYLPRPSVALAWQPRRNGNVDLVPFLAPAPASSPYLGISSRWVPPTETGLIWQLETGGTDTGLDPVRLATVFMVSPPDTEKIPEKGPGEDWLPFVQHHEFYNLSHRVQINTSVVAPERLTFLLGTIGELAVRPVVDAILDERAAQDMLAALRASNFRADGHYWSV